MPLNSQAFAIYGQSAKSSIRVAPFMTPTANSSVIASWLSVLRYCSPMRTKPLRTFWGMCSDPAFLSIICTPKNNLERSRFKHTCCHIQRTSIRILVFSQDVVPSYTLSKVSTSSTANIWDSLLKTSKLDWQIVKSTIQVVTDTQGGSLEKAESHQTNKHFLKSISPKRNWNKTHLKKGQSLALDKIEEFFQTLQMQCVQDCTWLFVRKQLNGNN